MRFLLVLILSVCAANAMAERNGISGYSTANCSGCHDVGSNTSVAGNQVVTIPGSTLVLANSTNAYTFRIASVDTGDDYGGFDVSASGGVLTAGSGSTIISGEVTHSDRKAISSNQVQWAFNWTAPATAGDYVLRGCGVTNAYVGMFIFAREDYKYTPCVTITITVNVPPVANAGIDQSLIEGSLVTLNGSASSDTTPGTISSRLWTQTSGTPTVTLSSATATSPTFTAPAVGSGGSVLTFSLTVTDNQGATAQDATIVSVTYNNPPVANAGVNQSVADTAGTVNLSGLGSTDDVSISSYAWVQTAGIAVTLNNASTATPSFTAPNVGPAGSTLLFQLTVTDNGGKPTSTTVEIAVYEGNAPPVANAGPDQSIIESSLVTLNSSASADADGSISSRVWLQTAGTAVSLSDANALNPTFTAPNVGASAVILTFRVTVTDNAGATAQDTVNITVTDPLPLVNAGSAIFSNEGVAPLPMAATASDNGNAITAYAWEQLSGPAVVFSATNILNPTVTLPATKADTVVQLHLTVTDNAGQARSDTLDINIINLNNLPVAVITDSAGNVPTTLLMDTYVTLSGNSSTDADGVIVSYLWAQTAGTNIVCNPGPCVLTNSTLTFQVPSVSLNETMTFSLQVTDDETPAGTHMTSINLLASNQLTVATEGGELAYEIAPVAAGAQLNSVTVTNVAPTSVTAANAPIDLPYGVTELVIALSPDPDPLASNGNAVRINLYLAQIQAADEFLYLNSNTNTNGSNDWINISDGLDFNNLVYSDGNWYLPIDSAEFIAPGVLQIYVSDGGPLDSDGVANGSITLRSGVGRNFQHGVSGALDGFTLSGLALLLMLRLWRNNCK